MPPKFLNCVIAVTGLALSAVKNKARIHALDQILSFVLGDLDLKYFGTSRVETS